MTSIAPVSLNNIETQWRCGLKSVFSVELHSRKRSSSYDRNQIIHGLVEMVENIDFIIFIMKHVAKSSKYTVFRYQSGSGCHGNPAHQIVTHLAGLPWQLSLTT